MPQEHNFARVSNDVGRSNYFSGYYIGGEWVRKNRVGEPWSQFIKGKGTAGMTVPDCAQIVPVKVKCYQTFTNETKNRTENQNFSSS